MNHRCILAHLPEISYICSHNERLCSNRFRNSERRKNQCLLCGCSDCAKRNDYSLIHPEPDYYTYWNTKVHGLTQADTDNAPIFPEVWRKIMPLIDRLPLVAHNKAFDESCLKAVFKCYQMTYPDYIFHCTLLKSRSVWPQGRHNLGIIAARCGYDLTQHHHALADAEACAAIALQIL